MNACRTRAEFSVQCPRCFGCMSRVAEDRLLCPSCSYGPSGASAYADLLGDANPGNRTDEHYTYQWGREKGFALFLERNPQIKQFMPSGQLGWPALFEEICTKARNGPAPVWVLDAACGYGGIAAELVQESTRNGLFYVGADIHHSLPNILTEQPLLQECGFLLRWDISKPVPVQHQFDYVICRNAIHHTPEPAATFRSLRERLKPGGRLAITAYRKKGMAREALDDRFREHITPLTTEAAFALSRQFTLLGKYLQAITQKVAIEEDLDLFGIERGTYSVQSLFYDHFLKCFYNQQFGEEQSTLVNFDWYHPAYAYRYDLSELVGWFESAGLQVVETKMIPAQYFVLGELP